MLDKTEMKELLEKSGVKNDKLENFEEHFEMAAGEHGKLVASNVSSGRKLAVLRLLMDDSGWISRLLKGLRLTELLLIRKQEK